MQLLHFAFWRGLEWCIITMIWTISILIMDSQHSHSRRKFGIPSNKVPDHIKDKRDKSCDFTEDVPDRFHLVFVSIILASAIVEWYLCQLKWLGPILHFIGVNGQRSVPLLFKHYLIRDEFLSMSITIPPEGKSPPEGILYVYNILGQVLSRLGNTFFI